MTYADVSAALDGWSSVHAPQEKTTPMTSDELADLMARYPD